MPERSPVRWSPRARERIRGLEPGERRAVERAAHELMESGASALDRPALSEDGALRWRLVGDFGVLEYRSYRAGENDELPKGGFYVTLVITEANTLKRIRQHLAATAK